ncbi:MAG: tripartite tricarboxylate transporter substrate binding protein [Rhodovarius sp.]|nr:tripartite tricarboxylate transporter substrate binding protein [Rhodovarius sp.]MCX7932611.1 tripartite tricarboxylate transporter substrate binding protein [Rhodovarius sp.]MDW8313879.1 tripartite tricarboxylate transporter substrate binding protein [Rhodovarius sp.]
MRIGRRAVTTAWATGAGLMMLAAPRSLRAQAEWPARPVRIVVPFAAGGSSDSVARGLAERLAANLGRPFVVENRPGLAGTIGVDHVAKSPADGYSFVIITSNQTINETLQPRRPFVLLRDLTPVAAINRLWLVFAASNALPVADFAGFLAHARAHPGRINYASSGPGSIFHLAAEMLRQRAGLEMVHVPFRQYSEARTQLIAGEIQLMADAVFTLEPLIRGGRMRGLATTGPARSRLLSEVPTVAESFPGFEIGLWNGLLAPAGTPAEIVRRMNAEVNRVLAEPAFVEANARLDIELTPAPPEVFAAFLEQDIARMREAVRAAHVEPEG